MNKYPGLSAIAGIISFIGWAAVVIGGVVVAIGLISALSPSPGASFLLTFSLLAGAQLALMGFLLAAAGGVIQVVIDIEANTRGITEPSSHERDSRAGRVAEHEQPLVTLREDRRISYLRTNGARIDGLDFDAFGNPIFNDTGTGGAWTTDQKNWVRRVLKIS